MLARLRQNQKVCQDSSWYGGNVMPTTPTTPATPATSPRGRRGQMTFSLQRLPEPLILDQVVLDPKWNQFKTFMVWIGGFLFLATTVLFGVFLTLATLWLFGGLSKSDGSPAAIQQNTAPQQPSSPQWKSYADCQRAYVLTLRQDPEGVCDHLK